MTPGQSEHALGELARARTSLREASALLELDLVDGAASRLYYAAFHATRAALTARGQSAKTHSGQISRFTATFGPTPLLGRLLQLRARADYQGGVDEPAEALRSVLGEVEGFICRCEQLVTTEGEGGPEPDPPPDV